MTTITVSQADIDAGQAANCFTCPIALAIARLFPGRLIKATSHFIEARGIGKWETPEVACHFMDAFDAGCTVTPFIFTLSP